MPGILKLVGTLLMAVAVAIRVGERRVVEALEAAGAVDPASATKVPPENFFQKWQFRRLLNAGVLGETMDQARYIKLVEYIAYRRRRRVRALMAVGIIGLLAVVLYFATGCTRKGATGVTRADSAGIEIVTISEAAFASAPVWSIDTASSLVTFGGGETPDQDIEVLTSARPLADGRWLVCTGAPAEVRVYSADGRFLTRLAREGSGPGEIQRGSSVLRLRGDTIVLYDPRQARLTELTTAGALVKTVSLVSLPLPLTRGIIGILGDGRPLSTKLWEEEAKAVLGRVSMSVFVLGSDGASVDTLTTFPGYHVVLAEMSEGGQTFTSATVPRFDGPSVIGVEGNGILVALPDSAVVVRMSLDGVTRRIVRLPIEVRPVTTELSERDILADSTSVAQRSPAFARDYGANTRKLPVAEHFPIFERIHQGPDGERWLERAWASVDSAKEYVILDSTGMVAATLTLPMDRTLWWIDQGWVLTSWRDEDGVRYLSKHPLHRTRS